jgi:hypothetical protein
MLKFPSQFVALFQLALPYNKHAPTELSKRTDDNPIALHVASQFTSPKFCSGLRHHSITAARVLMPEASVHKNGESPSRQYDIGATWQFPSTQ